MDIFIKADELRSLADGLDNPVECGGVFLEHHACTVLEFLATFDHYHHIFISMDQRIFIESIPALFSI